VVYDVVGRRVRTIENGIIPPGRYVRIWDGLGASGAQARSGAYFIRFAAPGVTFTRKAVLIR